MLGGSLEKSGPGLPEPMAVGAQLLGRQRRGCPRLQPRWDAGGAALGYGTARQRWGPGRSARLGGAAPFPPGDARAPPQASRASAVAPGRRGVGGRLTGPVGVRRPRAAGARPGAAAASAGQERADEPLAPIGAPGRPVDCIEPGCIGMGLGVAGCRARAPPAARNAKTHADAARFDAIDRPAGHTDRPHRFGGSLRAAETAAAAGRASAAGGRCRRGRHGQAAAHPLAAGHDVAAATLAAATEPQTGGNGTSPAKPRLRPGPPPLPRSAIPERRTTNIPPGLEPRAAAPLPPSGAQQRPRAPVLQGPISPSCRPASRLASPSWPAAATAAPRNGGDPPTSPATAETADTGGKPPHNT